MRRVELVLATMALTILLAGGVAQAIINGEPDTGPKAHPYVGALVTAPTSGEFKGQRVPVCSGTIISPKVFLTAGHCTEYLIKKNLPTYVSFDPTYEPGASRLIKGTSYLHPKYCLPTQNKAECAPPGRPEIVGTLPRTSATTSGWSS
jgi:hypothetical protein